jgi:hypothetical protein
MKKFLTITVLATLLLGCDISDVNIDPNAKSSVELAELLPVAITQSAFNAGAIMARSSGMLMQQWNQFDASIISVPYYRITRHEFDRYWNDAAYSGVLGMANTIIDLAKDPEELQYGAVAKILMAKELGVLTSSFGDIPYSKAFDIDLLEVPYDTQEEIYQTIQLLLDEAIVGLEQSTATTLEGDLVYQGDLSKWVQTAHALKARFYMHLTRRDVNASEKAMTEIELAFKGHSDQPDFKFGTDYLAANPIAQFAIGRPNTMVIHQHLATTMADTSDPRIAEYMYFDGSQGKFYQSGQYLFWSNNDAPMPLISYSELKFLEAEALLRSGNEVQAETSMQEAVRSNMEYLAIDGASTENYINAQVNFEGQIAIEEKLEKIMGEKYISLYVQGAIEIWVDYRRTGYPLLIPHEYGENELNPGGQIPQRLVYVQNEYITNARNVEAAAAHIGGDLLSTKLWAFE